MVQKKPRVSIGMPVYNGEKFIRQSIESILSQTYEDFELIISDNASNDQTKRICEIYKSKDSRIKFYSNNKNIGGPSNYNKVFHLSSGEFFKWSAYDDVLAPQFLEKCVSALDRDKTLIGCYTKTARIDENGHFLGYYNEGLLKNIDSVKPHERFRELTSLNYKPTPFHGLYRRSYFAKSQLHGSYIGADRNLVAELALIGRMYKIPECLFYWREHPDAYTSIFYGENKEDTSDSLLAQLGWWSSESGTYFTHWKNCDEYLKSINRISLSFFERFRCYIQVGDWFLSEGCRFMAGDVVMFLKNNSRFINKLISGLPPGLKRASPLKSNKIPSSIGFHAVIDNFKSYDFEISQKTQKMEK